MSVALAPCLWFDGKALEAARFYVSLLPGSRIDRVMPSPIDWPNGTVGDVLLVEFTLAGTAYQALNGGPGTPFTQAVSLSVGCRDQAEIDRLWDALCADGGRPLQCGWLTDRYGLSWQVVPAEFGRWMTESGEDARARIMNAVVSMTKLDYRALERARDGA